MHRARAIAVRVRGRQLILIIARHSIRKMSFVSARELEAERLARKEQQREMREEILREAKESFEKEKRREELKRARGEDTWILPAVKKRLGFKGEASEKKKKKKKDKKHKKHKKSKEQSESEKSEGEEEDMWVEKGSENSAKPSTSATCTSQISRYVNDFRVISSIYPQCPDFKLLLGHFLGQQKLSCSLRCPYFGPS